MNLGYLVNDEDDLNKPIDPKGKPHLEKLMAMGAKLTPVYLPPGPEGLGMIISAECASSFDSYTRSDKIQGHKSNGWPAIFRAARFVSAVDYLNADRARGALAKEYTSILSQFDAVVADDRVYPRVYALNCTGHPQILVPLPMGENNTPRSFSIIGNAFTEDALLGLAQTMLEEFGRDKERPDMSLWKS
jgi:Asp-tRNA(Asn)/Glu-tRNA(Gln) amidotransferase A subunit family amidase